MGSVLPFRPVGRLGRVTTKKKPPAKAASKYGPPRGYAGVVDEFGLVSDELAEMAKLKKRQEQIRKQILGWYEGAPEGESFVVQGNGYCVEVSPRQEQRKIRSMAKVFRHFKERLFLRLCTVPLKVIDDHIPASERDEYLVTERSGPRKVVSTRRVVEMPRAA